MVRLAQDGGHRGGHEPARGDATAWSASAPRTAAFRERTQGRSRLDGNVVFTDFRDESPLPVGNRFLVYTLFPEANVSLRVHWGPSREHVAAAVGHSIFNRTSRTNVRRADVALRRRRPPRRGHLPARRRATAEAQIAEIIATMKKDG